MENQEKIIDWTAQIYIGEYTKEQTLSGYIKALSEVIDRYAKPYTVESWVCTSTFGFGEGYRKREEVKGWKFGEGNVFSYVNRAFRGADLEEFQSAWQNFSHVPVGGVFEASSFLTYLKTKEASICDEKIKSI